MATLLDLLELLWSEHSSFCQLAAIKLVIKEAKVIKVVRFYICYGLHKLVSKRNLMIVKMKNNSEVL